MRKKSVYLLHTTAAILAMAMLAGSGGAHGQALAPEGRGLLAAPAEARADIGGVPPAQMFAPEGSGAFSRTVFATDADPQFTLAVRDYSFPPDHATHSVTLPGAAFLHLVSGEGQIRVGNKPLDLKAAARAAVPAGAAIEVATEGDDPVVVRALIVEGK